jgi:hypothetical protein
MWQSTATADPLPGRPQTIPDRHSSDLFLGGRVEGLERQSAFLLRYPC